jgi:hypothetical protein
MKITGTITKILPIEKGTSKEGKEWQKINFLVETTEQYNNLYCFEIFGVEKVENFTKYNKVGQSVDVEFNVSTNEWKGKYYTSLQAWKVFKGSPNDGLPVPEDFEKVSEADLNTPDNDLPF